MTIGDDERDARFRRMVDAHGAGLERLAAVYAVDADDRRDLLQDVLLAVWSALPSFRGDCSERTFVYRIGHNRGITHRARRRRHVSIDAVSELADPAADPARDAAASLSRDRLLRAVQSLPDTLRVPVSLHLEGFTHAEAAEVLGISENNVAVRLSRGRTMLRAILNPQAPE